LPIFQLAVGYEGAEGDQGGDEEIEPKPQRPLELNHAKGEDNAVGN
jgi:hypothetical protein